MPYYIMTRGYPWVTPSFMWRKWPIIPISQITRVYHWWQQLNVNCIRLGHSNHTAHSMTIWFSTLNKLSDSTKRTPRSSSWECCCHSSLISSTTLSINAFLSLHKCHIPKAYLSSGPVTYRIHLVIIRHHIPPTQTRQITKCLWILKRRLSIRYWYDTQGGLWLVRQYKNPVTIYWSYSLASSNCKSQCCRHTESIPTGPVTLEICRTTSVTMSIINSSWDILVGKNRCESSFMSIIVQV